MFAIYTTALLYGLDTTIAADVQPAIVESLGGIQKLTWVGVGFPLGSVATILPIGYAYGLFEIKFLYLASVVIFEAGSALCGGAPTMDALIVGRVIAGAGGAGMYLGALNYISIFTTLRERSLYAALIGLVWGVGTILGPVVGGGFAVSSATWRWSFYINLVLAAIMAPAMLFYIPRHQPKPNDSTLTKIRDMDWLGILLIAAVYITYTLALTFGGEQWAWSDGRFIAMITVFIVLLMTFVVTQYFAVFTTKERRIFPGQFLRRRSLVLLFFATSSTSTALFVGAYYIPLFFQFAHGDSAIEAAVRLLPFIMVTITFVMLNGGLMPLFGYYMPWYLFSGIFILIGGSLMFANINSQTSPSEIYGYSVLIAIGTGAALQTSYSVASAKVKPEEIPAVIGFINVAQIGSIVIALTISGAVFQNLAFNNLDHALAGHGLSVAEIHQAIAGTQSELFRTSSPELKAAAVKAIIEAMNKVYALVIAAGALTLVSALFMRREKLFMKVVAGG